MKLAQNEHVVQAWEYATGLFVNVTTTPQPFTAENNTAEETGTTNVKLGHEKAREIAEGIMAVAPEQQDRKNAA